MHGLFINVAIKWWQNLCIEMVRVQDLSRRKWSPATTGPPGPSMADFVAIDGPPGPTMAAVDGPLCRKWSPMNFATNT